MRESREGGPSVNDAIMEIYAIEQRVNTTGAVDSEPADFSLIRAKLEKGEITPSEAINQARGVEMSRQDYH